ncbi:MAG: NAD-dependent epimerase/dehydratase family protein, partial [Nocardioides sp.]|nr:NAD-dependent epimerase/dehydratase family protein [Nocardioides sp.]
MTVLVTGGTGYLGSLVVRRLADRGIGTVSVDVRDARDPVPGVAYVTADLRGLDLALLMGEHEVDAVVHLAAIVEPPKGMDEAELEDIEV